MCGSASAAMVPHHLLLNPEVLAPGGLCCPALHHLATSSASLMLSAPFPVADGYRAVFGIQGPSCLSIRPSGLSPLGFPELPPSTSAGSPTRAFPSSFRVGTGHREGETTPWHSDDPATNFPQGGFRRLVRSLSLRPFCLLASWVGRGELPLAPLRRLHPGFQP